MSSAVMQSPAPAASREAANQSFEAMLPELRSRARALAARYPSRMRRDAADDALGTMFLNHRQAAARGCRLSASDLAHFAVFHLRHRSLVTQRHYPSRRRVLRMREAMAAEPERLGRALSTSERDDPAERARISLDWEAFSDQLDARRRQILLGLAVGESKGRIAAGLGISPGRLSQILADVGAKVRQFFADE